MNNLNLFLKQFEFVVVLLYTHETILRESWLKVQNLDEI